MISKHNFQFSHDVRKQIFELTYLNITMKKFVYKTIYRKILIYYF